MLRPDDYIITTYRDHGQALARGMTPRVVMAELFGRVDGCAHGKGGSMHMFDKSLNFLGGHGIVGAHVPLGTGVGFAIKYRGGDQVCVCFMGESVVNTGAFHEALNMAGLWKLPVVYVIENNRYGMGTALERASAIHDVYERGAAYNIARGQCDGQDVFAVRAAMQRSDRARAHRVAADPARGSHLSLHGTLDVRRGERHVPQQGRARRVHEARPDRAAARAHARRGTADARTICTSSTTRSKPSCRTRGTSPTQSPGAAAGSAVRRRPRGYDQRSDRGASCHPRA